MYGPVRRDVTVIAAGPQAYASAESFVTKYFLRSTFKIPTGDKDDADLHENTPIPARQASPKASLKAGMSKTDERVLAFVEEINAFLNQPDITIVDFVEYCSADTTIEDRMAKIDAGVFNHLEAVQKLRQRITDLEVGV